LIGLPVFPSREGCPGGAGWVRFRKEFVFSARFHKVLVKRWATLPTWWAAGGKLKLNRDNKQ